MPNSIQFELAKPDDWQIIQKLNNQVFQADKDHDSDLMLDWPFSETGINYYHKLAQGLYGKCYIAYLEDHPVGYIALAIKDFGYRNSKYVEIENMGVDPEHRSKGIGKELINKAKEWAKSLDISKLYVQAYWHNTKAINFYKKCGFSEIGLELEMNLSK